MSVNRRNRSFDVVVISGVGMDTNIYLHGDDIDFDVEANFTENLDYVGQAGGYSSRGFARLGKKVALIDFIGDDHSGEFIRRELKKDRIDLSGVFVDPAGTRRSVNFMYRDGRRKNFYDGKGAMSLRPDIKACRKILQRAPLAHFNIVNFSRYLLPVARELGMTISCDIQDVVAANDPYLKEYIQCADVLFFSSVNHEDPSPLIMQFLGSNQRRIVIAGMGAGGCAVGTGQSVRFFETFEMAEPVIDTNGAGDSLAVGFLTSYLMDGFSLDESILRAQIAARYACAIRASSSTLITRKTLDDYSRRFH
jgi:acarbose 7IV-phosphotransferase